MPARGCTPFLPPNPGSVSAEGLFLSVSTGVFGDTPERLGGGLLWDREVREREALPLRSARPAAVHGPSGPPRAYSPSPRGPSGPCTLPAPSSAHARSRGGGRLPLSIMCPLTPLFLGDTRPPDQTRNMLTRLGSPHMAWPGSPRTLSPGARTPGRLPRGPDWVPCPVS